MCFLNIPFLPFCVLRESDCFKENCEITNIENIFFIHRMDGYMDQLKPIGWNTGRMAEASDADGNAIYLIDGQDGDVVYPHGDLKTILTIGEADATTG